MKKSRVLGITFVTVISATLAIFANCGKAVAEKKTHKPNNIEIYTARLGYTGYTLGFGLADLINKHSDWLKASAIETKGPVENLVTLIKHPEKQKIWVGFMGNLTRHMATKSIMPFRNPYDQVRAIGLTAQVCSFFSTLDPSIKTIHDFVGKSVMINTTPTIAGRMYEFILKDGLGIFDKIKIVRGHLGSSKTALVDGTVDVGWAGLNLAAPQPDGTWGWLAPPAIGELFLSKKAYVIEIPPEAVKKAAEATGWPFKPITVTGGTHGKTTWRTTTGSMFNLAWYVHMNMPEDVVTEIMRIMWEYADEFKSYHAAGAGITQETLSRVAEKENYFHPAALNWYKKQDVKKIGVE